MRSRRSSRPATGRPSSSAWTPPRGRPSPPRRARCGCAGSARCPTGRRSTCSTPCSSGAPTTGSCCSSTPTSTPSVPGPTWPTSWSTRRRSGPSWCGPTAAATSPTTGPGQLVGYPILDRPRQARAEAWPTRSPTCARSSSWSSTPSPTSGCPTSAASTTTRACGSPPSPTGPARSPPSACASPAAARCTASPSTWPPTWRCSATSCRAASPTSRSPRWPSEGIDVSMRQVVDALTARAVAQWAPDGRPWERADVVWRDATRGDDDLSPFSRGLGAGDAVRSAADHGVDAATGRRPGPARSPVDGPSPRMQGRLAEAGVVEGLCHLHPQARVAAGPGVARRQADGAQAHRPRPRPRSPCARKPAARTCRSAGPTAPPPS